MHTLPGSSRFPTKRWTIVVAAGDPHRKADQLWPLCARTTGIRCTPYLRRRGYAADQAHDLTQDFFIRVLEGRYLDRADPERAIPIISVDFPEVSLSLTRKTVSGPKSGRWGRCLARILDWRRALPTRAGAR